MSKLNKYLTKDVKTIDLSIPFHYYPQEDLLRLKNAVAGQYALEFNMSYAIKMPRSVLVMNIPNDDPGKVTKTAPIHLIQLMIKSLIRYEQPFNVYKL